MTQVTVIVMITKLVEDNKRKAHQYWPDESDGDDSLGQVFELGGGIRVEHLSSSFQGSYFLRRFCIQMQDGSQREVFQLHTEMWPDLTAPEEPRSCYQFTDIYKMELLQDTTGPCLQIFRSSIDE